MLREAYRRCAAAAPLQEEQIRRVVTLVRPAGADPILIKGWSVARLYAEPGLRPYGDIDLCVAPPQLTAAATALASGRPAGDVDLHSGVSDLPDRTWEEVSRRSRLVPLGDVTVRVLGVEDQLRLLCFHFVRHGGSRPLWLCDVAAALEAADSAFDWDLVLGGNPRVRDWVLCVAGLACRLLDTRCDHPAVKAAADSLPPWLVRSVLWKWGSSRERRPLVDHLRHPLRALDALRHHWLNPVRSVFQLGLSPKTRVPLPLVQTGAVVVSESLRRYRSVRKRLAPRAAAVNVHQDTEPLARRSYSRRPSEPARRSAWRRWGLPLLAFLGVFFLLRSVVADVFSIPSGSMRPTLVEGDRILVSPLAYGLPVPFTPWRALDWFEPGRGDVVVFRSPLDGRCCVKRVAGVPGDEVGDVRVPPGHVFLLGDNRDNSLDSRSYGPVARSLIVGRTLGVVVSLDPDAYCLPRWHRTGQPIPLERFQLQCSVRSV